MKKIHEIFNKKPEVLQNKQMKNAIIEMKNTLEGINIRINEAEKWISELEDRLMEITVAE